jgi:hypothetical protein
MPLHFSDEEINLLLTLSEPIDRKQRHEFLRAVVNELAICELAACEQPSGGGGGGGLGHRVARQVQRRYSLAPLPGTSKHARPECLVVPQCAAPQRVHSDGEGESDDESHKVQ